VVTATKKTARGTSRLSLREGRWRPVVSWLLRLTTAAGLAVDAVVHHDLAARYDPNQGSGPLSQGDLFQLEAVASIVVALALLLTTWRVVWLLALLISASALGAMLLYRYHDPGPIGPLPDMYEPYWFTEKVVAGVAEGVATVTAAAGLFLHRRGRL
jgi:hypothetical protein